MVVGHQVTVPPGTISSVPSSMGEEVTNEAREYARISVGTFQLKCTINFVPGVTIVSQVLSYFFLPRLRLRLFSRLRATPVVVGHQVTVPPGTVSSVPSSMGA